MLQDHKLLILLYCLVLTCACSLCTKKPGEELASKAPAFVRA